jgi:hypothetical protein
MPLNYIGQTVVQQVRANSVIALLSVHPGDTLNILPASAPLVSEVANGIAEASPLAAAMGVTMNVAGTLACQAH